MKKPKISLFAYIIAIKLFTPLIIIEQVIRQPKSLKSDLRQIYRQLKFISSLKKH